jgi:hypothetical protein
MKVRNMESSRGNTVPNQFIVEHGNQEYFQSYNTVIVLKDFDHGTIALDADKWDYSVTTGKYRNQFLGETKKETQKKIDSGEYKLVNLN